MFVTYTVGEFKFPNLGTEMALSVAHGSYLFENPPPVLHLFLTFGQEFGQTEAFKTGQSVN